MWGSTSRYLWRVWTFCFAATSPILLPTFHPPSSSPPLAPHLKVRPSFRETWRKSSPAPVHVGSLAPRNLLRFSTDYAASPVQVSRLHPGVLSWLHRLLREPPGDFVQKTVEQSPFPASWKPLIARGKEWESGNIGMISFFLKNKAYDQSMSRVMFSDVCIWTPRECIRPVECPEVWLFINLMEVEFVLDPPFN